jgi:uncharacterized protein
MAITEDAAGAAVPSPGVVLRLGLQAVERQDWDAVRAVCAEDVVWHLPGRGPLSGEVHGPDEVVELFVTMQGATAQDQPARVVTVLEGPAHAALVQSNEVLGHGGGTTVTMVTLASVRDGRITELRYLTSDQDAVDALWTDRLGPANRLRLGGRP